MFSGFNPNDVSVLTFNVTWHCPVKCPYCYRARSVSQTQKLLLSTDVLARECTIAKDSGIREYRISGGEPISIGDKLFEYANIVYDLTGKRPILMTSGWGIDDRWLKKATNKFSAIAVSIDNPMIKQRSSLDSDRLLDLMNQNYSNETPFTFGLTLVTAEYFKDIVDIFNLLYNRFNYRAMPQLDYECLRSFRQPNAEQISNIQSSTEILFREYDVIPYYFVYIVGSLLWLKDNIRRIVINLHPEGNYQIYNSMIERWNVESRWQNYILDQQAHSDICKNCDWVSSCKYHPLWELKYDWCGLRKAIFQGMYNGLDVEPQISNSS